MRAAVSEIRSHFGATRMSRIDDRTRGRGRIACAWCSTAKNSSAKTRRPNGNSSVIRTSGCARPIVSCRIAPRASTTFAVMVVPCSSSNFLKSVPRICTGGSWTNVTLFGAGSEVGMPPETSVIA